MLRRIYICLCFGSGWSYRSRVAVVGLFEFGSDPSACLPSPSNPTNPPKKINNPKQAFDMRDNIAEIFALNKRPGEFACFDGLRAISCGWVVIYHVLLWQVRE